MNGASGADAVAVERFTAAVSADPADVRLDVAALCIAAQANPALDVDAWCARLDEIAAGCAEQTFDGLRAHLFGEGGLRGNVDDYGDPENSFLDRVLTRRLGIPISLSVVMMEVGRRCGVDVVGVGMPGHFIVQDGAHDDVWCDPFHGGASLDLDACARLFARAHGGRHQFHRAYLTPSGPRSIVARMLTNLEQGRLARDPVMLARLCALHLRIPELGDGERERVEVVRNSARARWN